MTDQLETSLINVLVRPSYCIFTINLNMTGTGTKKLDCKQAFTLHPNPKTKAETYCPHCSGGSPYSCLSAGSAQCEMNTSLVSNTTDSGRIIECLLTGGVVYYSAVAVREDSLRHVTRFTHQEVRRFVTLGTRWRTGPQQSVRVPGRPETTHLRHHQRSGGNQPHHQEI